MHIVGIGLYIMGKGVQKAYHIIGLLSVIVSFIALILSLIMYFIGYGIEYLVYSIVWTILFVVNYYIWRHGPKETHS